MHKFPVPRACWWKTHDGAFQALNAADVTWRADGNIKLSVRAEAGVAPTMGGIVGQFIVKHFGLRAF
ncbi:MAG: hypothetical protein ACKVHL_03020 [Rhodospirillales bacterium]